jgi:hypothetical protein
MEDGWTTFKMYVLNSLALNQVAERHLLKVNSKPI